MLAASDSIEGKTIIALQQTRKRCSYKVVTYILTWIEPHAMDRRRPKKDTAKSDGSSSSLPSLITASCGGSGRRLTPVDFFGFFFLGDNENWRGSQSFKGARKDRGRAACREDVSGIAKDQRAAEDGEWAVGNEERNEDLAVDFSGPFT